MALSVAARNHMLEAGLRNQSPTLALTHASLHTADPEPSGGSEVTGGSYARKAISWTGAASGGVLTMSGTPVFDVPSSTTVAFVGFWTAITAGTWLGSYDVANETFTNAGTYTLTSLTVTLT